MSSVVTGTPSERPRPLGATPVPTLSAVPSRPPRPQAPIADGRPSGAAPVAEVPVEQPTIEPVACDAPQEQEARRRYPTHTAAARALVDPDLRWLSNRDGLRTLGPSPDRQGHVRLRLTGPEPITAGAPAPQVVDVPERLAGRLLEVGLSYLAVSPAPVPVVRLAFAIGMEFQLGAVHDCSDRFQRLLDVYAARRMRLPVEVVHDIGRQPRSTVAQDLLAFSPHVARLWEQTPPQERVVQQEGFGEQAGYGGERLFTLELAVPAAWPGDKRLTARTARAWVSFLPLDLEHGTGPPQSTQRTDPGERWELWLTNERPFRDAVHRPYGRVLALPPGATDRFGIAPRGEVLRLRVPPALQGWSAFLACAERGTSLCLEVVPEQPGAGLEAGARGSGAA